jgi:hypothetical protein
MTQKHFGSRHCLSQVGGTAVDEGARMGKSAVLVVYKVVMGGLESGRTRNVVNHKLQWCQAALGRPRVSHPLRLTQASPGTHPAGVSKKRHHPTPEAG